MLLRGKAATSHSLHLPLQETEYHRVGAKVGLQQRPLGVARLSTEVPEPWREMRPVSQREVEC